jgi:MFS family permease
MLNKTIRILILGEACFMFAAGLFGPIYAIFVTDIGGDLLDAGWAWALFMLTAGALLYVLSRWENKYKHYEQLVIGGYTAQAIAVFCYIFVQNSWQLMVVQVVLGIGEAFTVPAYDALFTKSIKHGEEAKTWGDWETMKYIVTAISAIIGGAIATVFGFRGLFLFMFAMSILGLLVLIRLMPRWMHYIKPTPAELRVRK